MTTRNPQSPPPPRPSSTQEIAGRSIFPTFAVNVPMPSGTSAPSSSAPAQPSSGSSSAQQGRRP